MANDDGGITDWMVLTVQVASNCGGTSHYIARSDHSQSSMEIAEILAYGDVLEEAKRIEVEQYLMAKWLPEQSSSNINRINTRAVDSTHPLVIGGNAYPRTDQNFVGLMKRVRIWDRALTAEEVSADFDDRGIMPVLSLKSGLVANIVAHASGTMFDVRARPGRLSALSVPQRFPMKIHFVWGFCMGAQGA
jgi:hypothetical protein